MSGKRRRYLITGGAGFIGSHLAEKLLDAKSEVAVIDDLSTGRQANIEHLIGRDGFQFARASVLDRQVLDRMGSEADVIVHLAAAVGVQLIVDNPVHTIETNIMGTDDVLRVAKRYGCKTLIASTSEVYGKGASIPFSEDDDVVLGSTRHSRWAYGASKMVDEFLGLAYARQYGLHVVVFRLFNTVGPRQTGRYGMVMPRFVMQALAGDPISVYGDGTQQRCFCDVEDVVHAIIGLAENDAASGEVFNIGNDEEITILGLAEKVRTIAGSSSEIVQIPYDQAYGQGFEDMQRRVPDVSKLKELLTWEPLLSLDGIIEKLVNYRKAEDTVEGR